MNYKLEHDGKGRMRIRLSQKSMTCECADALEVYMRKLPEIDRVCVHERTGSVILSYHGSKKNVLHFLDDLKMKDVIAHRNQEESDKKLLLDTPRGLRRKYEEDLMRTFLKRILMLTVCPEPLMMAITAASAARCIGMAAGLGRQKKSKTALLQSAELLAHASQADVGSAGTDIFLMDVCSVLENSVNRQKVESLAEAMHLNIDYVTRVSGEDVQLTKEEAAKNTKDVQLILAEQVKCGDLILVREDEMIPFDGVVVRGEGSVIQTGLVGNALPRVKRPGDDVYAGTMIEEGRIVLRVKERNGVSVYDRIIDMVDESENSKPEFEVMAVKNMEKTVPYRLAGAAVACLITCDPGRASTLLMTDLDYNLKLTLPAAVMAARRKLRKHHVILKSGKFMETVAVADTYVFDKTGTLTKAHPVLKKIISYGDYSEEELLAMAACMEEHFDHVMANAITCAATERGLSHEEMHTEVENIAAHGIVTSINGKRALIGSYHFIFEDEKCSMPETLMDDVYGGRGADDRHLFLAIDQKTEAVFFIADELKEEAGELIRTLREKFGVSTVLLTGDSLLTTEDMAKSLGVDEYHAQLLPTDKADYIKKLKEEGHVVVMVGDGVNDSLALSMADVGVAISEGSEIARAVADVIVDEENILGILALREITGELIHRLQRDYHMAAGISLGLAGAGVLGVMTPGMVSCIEKGMTLAMALEEMES